MTYTPEEMCVFLAFAALSGFLLARVLDDRARARRAAARAASDAGLRSELVSLRAALVERDREVREGAVRIGEVESRLAAAEAACSRLREERDAFRRRADELEARAVPLPRPSARLPGPYLPDGPPRIPRPAPREPADAAPAERPARVTEPRPAAARSVARRSGIALPEHLRPRPLPPSDDLEAIRGIGPATARRLRDLGIRTWAAIAAWEDADVERIGGEIGAAPARIRRDDWVGQARALEAARTRR